MLCGARSHVWDAVVRVVRCPRCGSRSYVWGGRDNLTSSHLLTKLDATHVRKLLAHYSWRQRPRTEMKCYSIYENSSKLKSTQSSLLINYRRFFRQAGCWWAGRPIIVCRCSVDISTVVCMQMLSGHVYCRLYGDVKWVDMSTVVCMEMLSGHVTVVCMEMLSGHVDCRLYGDVKWTCHCRLYGDVKWTCHCRLYGDVKWTCYCRLYGDETREEILYNIIRKLSMHCLHMYLVIIINW